MDSNRNYSVFPIGIISFFPKTKHNKNLDNNYIISIGIHFDLFYDNCLDFVSVSMLFKG